MSISSDGGSSQRSVGIHGSMSISSNRGSYSDGSSNRLNMDISLSRDLDINVGLSGDLDINVGLSSDLLMDIGLSSNLLMHIGLSGDLLINIGLSSNLLVDIGLSSNFLMHIGLSGDLLINIGLSSDLFMDVGLGSGVKVGISDRWVIDSSIDSSIGNWSAGKSGSSNRGNTVVGHWGGSSVPVGIWVSIGGACKKSGLGRDRGHEGKNGSKGFHFSCALLLLYECNSWISIG